jgi:peroxiredoxin
MKKIFLFAFMAVCSFSVKAQTNYDISVQNPSLSGKVYLFSLAGGMRIDSAQVADGKCSMKGSVKEPLFGILIGNNGGFQNPVYVDDTPLVLGEKAAQAKGSTVNMRLAAAIENLDSLEKAKVNPSDFIRQTIEANRDNIIPVLFLTYFGDNLDANYVENYLKTYTAYNSNPLMQRVIKNVASAKKTAIGAKAPEFSLKDPKGKLHKLSSYLGKSYVLLDFWASWCGPCRGEMPNVKKAYAQFKAKGFQIVGVSLDDKAAAWTGAIKSIGITWPQLSDLKGWKCSAADLYGVHAIPATFLLDAKGNIIARDLRGEELLNKLAELYKK